MTLDVLALGSADPETVAALSSQPSFRKATRSMALACAAIGSALGANTFIASLPRARLGFVLGSSFGELEATKDFLQTLFESQMARPLLFQNSLHNSTTGFASLTNGFTGPVVTVSHGMFAAEHALDAAELLLFQNSCDAVVIVTVDHFVPQLTNGALAPGEGAHAAAMLVAKTGTAPVPPLARIESVKTHRAPSTPRPTYGELSIESTLEKLNAAIAQARVAAKVSPSELLVIEKPRGCRTEIIWSHA